MFSWLRDLAGKEVGFIKIRAGMEDLLLRDRSWYESGERSYLERTGTEVQTESSVWVDWRMSSCDGLKGLSTSVTWKE